MHHPWGRMLAGAIAGCVATVPMSLVMLARRNVTIREYLEPLPPRQITSRALHRVGLAGHLSEESHESLTVTSHFGYGTMMGGLFGLVTPPQSPGRSTVTGVGFGMGVWAASYLGWLPWSGLYRSAAEDTEERTLRMVAAHVVWGATVGCVTELADQALNRDDGSADDEEEREVLPPRRERVKPR